MVESGQAQNILHPVYTCNASCKQGLNLTFKILFIRQHQNTSKVCDVNNCKWHLKISAILFIHPHEKKCASIVFSNYSLSSSPLIIITILCTCYSSWKIIAIKQNWALPISLYDARQKQWLQSWRHYVFLFVFFHIMLNSHDIYHWQNTDGCHSWY